MRKINKVLTGVGFTTLVGWAGITTTLAALWAPTTSKKEAHWADAKELISQGQAEETEAPSTLVGTTDISQLPSREGSYLGGDRHMNGAHGGADYGYIGIENLNIMEGWTEYPSKEYGSSGQIQPTIILRDQSTLESPAPVKPTRPRQTQPKVKQPDHTKPSNR